MAKGLNEQATRFTAAFETSMEATSKALAYEEFWNIKREERTQYSETIAQFKTGALEMEHSLAELN